LRRGDYHGTVHEGVLHQGELRVTGAWRHVNYEVVQLAPLHVTEELGDDLHDYGSAPDGRLIARDEESQRDELHAVRLVRDDPFVGAGLQWAVHTHHARDVGAVDVGIHYTHALPRGCERNGQVHRHGALPHPALA